MSLLERVLKQQGQDKEAINNIRDDIAAILSTLEAQAAQLKVLSDLLEQGKGGLRVLAWIGAGTVALVGMIASIIAWIRN